MFICDKGQIVQANRALLCGQSKFLSSLMKEDHVQGQGHVSFVSLAGVQAGHVQGVMDLLTRGQVPMDKEIVETMGIFGIGLDTFEVCRVEDILRENQEIVDKGSIGDNSGQDSVNIDYLKDAPENNHPKAIKDSSEDVVKDPATLLTKPHQKDDEREPLKVECGIEQVAGDETIKDEDPDYDVNDDIELLEVDDYDSDDTTIKETSNRHRRSIKDAPRGSRARKSQVRSTGPKKHYMTLTQVDDLKKYEHDVEQYHPDLVDNSKSSEYFVPGSKQRVLKFLHSWYDNRTNLICPYCPRRLKKIVPAKIKAHVTLHFQDRLKKKYSSAEGGKCPVCMSEKIYRDFSKLIPHLTTEHDTMKGIWPDILDDLFEKVLRKKNDKENDNPPSKRIKLLQSQTP